MKDDMIEKMADVICEENREQIEEWDSYDGE